MCDGLIEIRVLDQEGPAKNFLRIRALKGQPHDAAWHEIKPLRNAAVLVTYRIILNEDVMRRLETHTIA